MDCQNVLYSIMQYLPWRDLRSMECVCKLYQLVAREVFKPLDLIIKDGLPMSVMMNSIQSHHYSVQFKDSKGTITHMDYKCHNFWRVQSNWNKSEDMSSWNVGNRMISQFTEKYVFDPLSLVTLGGFDEYIAIRYFQLINLNDPINMWLHILLLHDSECRIMFCRHADSNILDHMKIKLMELNAHVEYYIKEFQKEQYEKLYRKLHNLPEPVIYWD